MKKYLFSLAMALAFMLYGILIYEFGWWGLLAAIPCASVVTARDKYCFSDVPQQIDTEEE